MSAPANDNQANATILDSETGSLASQTTVDSTGEASPAVTGSYTITNGHDVWFKWRMGWISAGQALPYRIWTEDANFRHVIRAYLRTGQYTSVLAVKKSKGFFTQHKFDKRQVIEIAPVIGYYYTGLLSTTYNDTYVYIQVDAADGTTDEGTFTLKWDRSRRLSIGGLGGHSAFQDPPGMYSVFKELQSVTDVSAQTQYWFNGGASLPAGLYRVQYVDGYFQLASGAGNPSGETESVFDTQVEILYNDSLSGHDGISSFAAMATGYTGEIWVSDRPNYTDPFTTKIRGRFSSQIFTHTGGKIGIQFRHLYTNVWYFQHDLPNWLSVSQDSLPDAGYPDNSMPATVKFALWRHVPQLKFKPSSAFYYGPSAGPPAHWFCTALNDTPLTLAGIDMYKKVAGVPTSVAHNKSFAPHGTNTSVDILVDFTVMPVIQRVYFSIPAQPDIPEVYCDFDLTPVLDLYDKTYYGVVTSGGMQKWSCQVHFRNLCPYGYWLNHPTVTLVSGGTDVEYTSSQDMGHFQLNDGYINFKVRPPAGAGTVTFGFQVSDSGWTSPILYATLTGTPV